MLRLTRIQCYDKFTFEKFGRLHLKTIFVKLAQPHILQRNIVSTMVYLHNTIHLLDN